VHGRAIELIMGFSHADIHRLLPAALEGLTPTWAGDSLVARRAGGEVRVRLGPEGVRALGAMRLPSTPVRLEFDGYGDAEVTCFMDRFYACFRRAGG
jgi:hypothetical protein